MPLPRFSSKTTATTPFDKAKVIRAAEKFLSQGKISAAIKEYRKLVDYDAKDFMALNMLGDLYVRNDKKEDAITCFSKIADHYREQGFALKAIAMYKKIDRLNPGTPQIAFRLAGLYAQLGMVVEARSEYLVVAEAYTKSNQAQKALEILRRIADLDPHNAEVRLKLGESYLRENFRQEAAEAFTESGNQMLAQGNYERAQSAFNQALLLFPEDVTAIKGAVGAHIALGTADEAAEMLEKVLVDHAGNTELLTLLVQSYIEEKDPQAAEGAVLRLVERLPTSYQHFVDVARLYLKAGDVDAAVRVMGRITEPMLAGREDHVLLALLQEALDRNPEQIQALHLLIRIHTWQRDDERLRVALDRLAEAAEAAGLADEERSALKQLLRFAPAEERYHSRLRELGIVTSPFATHSSSSSVDASPVISMPAAAPTPEAKVGVPTFESFMLAYDEGQSPASTEGEDKFNWNGGETAADGGSSFADLNDEAAVAEQRAISGGEANQAPVTFGELDLSDSTVIAGAGEVASPQDGGDQEGLLKQELDSVDFYLAQGYHDIALDTINMLERQFGPHPEIVERRARLRAEGVTGAEEPATSADLSFAEPAPKTPTTEVAHQDARYGANKESDAASSFVLNGDAAVVEHGDIDISFAALEAESPAVAPPTTNGTGRKQKAATSSAAAPAERGGLDSGLADIFNEFATEVESEGAPQDADYETHYNLGLAFQEMDLWDDSIEELQTAISMVTPHDGTSRYLQCCNMLGHCFMRKSMMPLAVMWFRKGLSAPGHTEDEYQALRYELGSAYESMGDLEQAITVFTEVYGVNVSYRGVARKIQELQTQRAAQ